MKAVTGETVLDLFLGLRCFDGLSLFAEGGAALCCGARASHCSGFSCCSARALNG